MILFLYLYLNLLMLLMRGQPPQYMDVYHLHSAQPYFKIVKPVFHWTIGHISNYFWSQTVPPAPLPCLLTSYLILYWGFRDLLLATLSVHKSLPCESKLFMLGVVPSSDIRHCPLLRFFNIPGFVQDWALNVQNPGGLPGWQKPGKKIVTKSNQTDARIFFVKLPFV